MACWGGGGKLEVVTEYNYLGLLFSTKLNTNVMLRQVFSKAKSAFCRITRLSNNLNNMSFIVLCEIFDAQIQTILLYGSELWGLDDISIIESVHIFSLKKILNVPLFTPNIMVYGDTGRYQLRINSVLRCVKYWLRLLNMNNDRYACKVYKMMLHGSNCCNWASEIKEFLFNFNFNDVWEAQTVDDSQLFIRTLKQRMIGESDNNWLISLNSSNRYSVYKLYKQFRYKENYLNVISSGISRRVAYRFRMGVSLIMTHKLGFILDSDTVCPMCMEEEEDEIHFILHCPVYRLIAHQM